MQPFQALKLKKFNTMTLSERDQQTIWHPYTQQVPEHAALPIICAEGCYLYDEQNKRYIDAISSWWVTLHGHSHPYIAARVARQLRKLDQVIFAGFTHEPAIALAEKLLAILPENQEKVFYTDNGSTAIEVALKMCIQYWANYGIQRTKILAFEQGYHGDTFGAMSVSGRNTWTAPFNSFLFEVIFIPAPDKSNLEASRKLIAEAREQIACFIYEPLIQGSAGMLMHDSEDLDQLLSFCHALGILLIQDEVFTGFGRTGRNFAADYLQQAPDIFCFSKGLTGGTIPLGATTCNHKIYEAFLSADRTKTLFHGHSFTANPLACTAALASIELLLQPGTRKNIARICARHTEFRTRCGNHPKLQAVRQTGTVLALEWKTGTENSYFNPVRDLLYRYFLDHGILIRPLGNVVYLLPPYCVSDQDLDQIYRTIEQALALF